MDFYFAKVVEEQKLLTLQSISTTGHRLNTLAAIFLPLTAVGGIFGINMRSGLEQLDLWLFWLVFAGGLVLGLLVRGWALRLPPEPSQ